MSQLYINFLTNLKKKEEMNDITNNMSIYNISFK